MVDCGEGTQIQLRRSKIHFARINNIFISHLHGDHCFGLIGIISTFGLLGRTAPLHVFADRHLKPVLDLQLKVFASGLDFSVEFHPIDTYKSNVIYEDKSLTVTTIPLSHRIPCCGFLFREKQTLPHIRRDEIDFYHIPNYALQNIKEGNDWITDDGVHVPASKLTTEAEKARSYAYCSDTAYSPGIVDVIKGVDLLYHEATYGEDRKDNAEKYFHSTAAQAAAIARDAQVGKLVIGHYSARYDDENILLNEARAVFNRTELSDENKVFSVKRS